MADYKKYGFLAQKQDDKLVLRLRSLAGNLTSEQLRQIADIADEYGQGYIHLTTRQGAEIPWINSADFDAVNGQVQDRGLLAGASGGRIRTIIACPGAEVCKSGIMNSRATAVEIDKSFFGREVPIKVKIAVSGCPNSCAKPQENDIGLVGVVEPVIDADMCISCGICEEACPVNAIEIVDDVPVIDQSKCIKDGKCMTACPQEAIKAGRKGYNLYTGGKIGRRPHLGQVVASYIPEDQVIESVEKVLAAFLVLRQDGERIGDTIERIGLEVFVNSIETRER
ncbi:MAG: 4Fe-4S binding protein [Candidatus Saccharibacteria bacterium]